MKSSQSLKFMTVGTSGFLINSAILLLLNNNLGMSDIAAEIVAIFFSLHATFLLHEKWTFSESCEKYHLGFKARYVSYLTSNAISSALTTLIFAILAILIPDIFSLAIASFIGMLWNYVIGRSYVWRPKAIETVLIDKS